MKYGIIQKCDIKSKLWASHCSPEKKLICLEKSQIYSVLDLVICIFKNKKLPDFFIFRYLNDYEELSKTLLRTFSEVLTLILCTLLRIKVYWLCHNVDKETTSHYPYFTNLRRQLLLATCSKIFVTSPFLIEHAKYFLKTRKTIVPISFGSTEFNNKLSSVDEGKVRLAEEFLEARNDKNTYTCLISGHPVQKTLHFSHIENLIQQFDIIGKKLLVVISGDFSEAPDEMLNSYNKNTNIIFFDTYTKFSSNFIERNIDFYFRVYDDYSVPYTIFEACSFNKPILTMKYGVLPDIVNSYKIGSVVDDDLLNLPEVIHTFSQIKPSYFKRFLTDNNWDSLAIELGYK